MRAPANGPVRPRCDREPVMRWIFSILLCAASGVAAVGSNAATGAPAPSAIDAEPAELSPTVESGADARLAELQQAHVDSVIEQLDRRADASAAALALLLSPRPPELARFEPDSDANRAWQARWDRVLQAPEQLPASVLYGLAQAPLQWLALPQADALRAALYRRHGGNLAAWEPALHAARARPEEQLQRLLQQAAAQVRGYDRQRSALVRELAQALASQPLDAEWRALLLQALSERWHDAPPQPWSDADLMTLMASELEPATASTRTVAWQSICARVDRSSAGELASACPTLIERASQAPGSVEDWAAVLRAWDWMEGDFEGVGSARRALWRQLEWLDEQRQALAPERSAAAMQAWLRYLQRPDPQPLVWLRQQLQQHGRPWQPPQHWQPSQSEAAAGADSEHERLLMQRHLQRVVAELDLRGDGESAALALLLEDKLALWGLARGAAGPVPEDRQRAAAAARMQRIEAALESLPEELLLAIAEPLLQTAAPEQRSPWQQRLQRRLGGQLGWWLWRLQALPPEDAAAIDAVLADAATQGEAAESSGYRLLPRLSAALALPAWEPELRVVLQRLREQRFDQPVAVASEAAELAFEWALGLTAALGAAPADRWTSACAPESVATRPPRRASCLAIAQRAADAAGNGIDLTLALGVWHRLVEGSEAEAAVIERKRQLHWWLESLTWSADIRSPALWMAWRDYVQGPAASELGWLRQRLTRRGLPLQPPEHWQPADPRVLLARR